MIYGIGTDIVSIARIQASLDRQGEKFARRILAETELAGFQQSVRPANYLAKRFAAKEATVKAMGTGFADGVTMTQIVVHHDDRGKPLLRFSGRADELIQATGIGAAHISISDEHDFAVAFVTLSFQ